MEATPQAMNELKQKEAAKERKLALEKQAAMDSAAVIKDKTVKFDPVTEEIIRKEQSIFKFQKYVILFILYQY